MTTLARRNSSIHKIREYSLKKAKFEDEYDILRTIQEAWKSRLLLVEHRKTRNEVVLKAVHKEATTKVEFFREFHYNYYLSPHPNILNAYDVSFEAQGYYMFAQEFAPFGDLASNFSEHGLGEVNTKKIVLQIASALEFMHSKDLVHRDINMDNILVFNLDFSEVKLCDFGATRKEGTLLKKKTIWLPYAPPEVVDTVQNEGYYVDKKQDVWQFGILIYALITGSLPWHKADITDPLYLEYLTWKKRKLLKTPKRFANFTNRMLRLFKRLLEPTMDKRVEVQELYKYIDDKWLARTPKKTNNEPDNQSICYSTFSLHSSKPEKDQILHVLKAHGIETTVDRSDKRKRIHDWIERTVPDPSENAKLKSPAVITNVSSNLIASKTERSQHIRPTDLSNDLNHLSMRDSNYDRQVRMVTPIKASFIHKPNSDDENHSPPNQSRRESSASIEIKPTNRQSTTRRPSANHTTKSHQIFDLYMQDTGTSKSPYQGSPSRGSPFRQVVPADLTQQESARVSRAKQVRAAGRSHSARVAKSQMYSRSRSLARDPFADYELQRSKTDTEVETRKHEDNSDNSDTDSQNSFTSILPMTGR